MRGSLSKGEAVIKHQGHFAAQETEAFRRMAEMHEKVLRQLDALGVKYTVDHDFVCVDAPPEKLEAVKNVLSWLGPNGG